MIHEPGTYNNKVDVWAIGCIFFELIFLKPAFSNDIAVFKYYSEKMRLEMPSNDKEDMFPDDISRDLAFRLLYDIFEIDHAKRPSAQGIRSGLTAIFDAKSDFTSTDQSTLDISNRLNDMALSQSADPIEVNTLSIIVSDHESGIRQGRRV